MTEQTRSYHAVGADGDVITYFDAIGREAVDDYAPFDCDTPAKTDHGRVSQIHAGAHEYNTQPALQEEQLDESAHRPEQSSQDHG
jgi:hypothetical protein